MAIPGLDPNDPNKPKPAPQVPVATPAPGSPQQTLAALPPAATATTPPVNNTGTVKGNNPFTNNPVINKIPGHSYISTALDPGNILAPTQVDLSGVNAAGAAATAQAQELANERANVSVTAPTIDTSQSNQTRSQQEQALAALTAQANGTAPSAADIQAEAARQANVANQLGIAASQRGHSPGSALATAAMGTADINSQAAAAGAAQRAQEQATAQNNLVAALGGVRGQDTTSATNQAQLQSTAEGQQLGYQGQLLSGQVASTGQDVTAETGGANAAAENAKGANSMGGGVLSAVGSLVSDRRAKEDVRPALKEANQMLDALRPESFEYKPEMRDQPGAGPGHRLGVMAQDMERSPAGREIVIEGDPKKLDVSKALSASLAALAALNTRLRKVEGR